MNYYERTKTKKSPKKVVFIVIVGLLIVAGSVLWWWHRSHKSTASINVNNGTATANPNVSGGQAQNSGSNSNTSSTIGPTNSKDQASNTPSSALPNGVQPATPTGDFVSTHTASLGTLENSTCNTTAGALCQIRFTKGSTIVGLPAQQTNAAGSTSWDWTINKYLSSGTWKVTAVAINGSKTASTTDADQLVVSP